LNNLGRCLAEQGKTKEAINHFSDAARLNPNYLEAHFNLANAYMTERRYVEAMAEFNEALRIQPKFAPAERGLARARASIGN
jgi:tetratricopeptide (TPR) repeat protein